MLLNNILNVSHMSGKNNTLENTTGIYVKYEAKVWYI
jgi:hypothetical protein